MSASPNPRTGSARRWEASWSLVLARGDQRQSAWASLLLVYRYWDVTHTHIKGMLLTTLLFSNAVTQYIVPRGYRSIGRVFVLNVLHVITLRNPGPRYGVAWALLPSIWQPVLSDDYCVNLGFSMPPPLIGGGIKRWCCLTSVCLSVCRVPRL